MENIKEIHNIIKSLNAKEKRAAKQFFSRYSDNTKELLLFNAIDKFGDAKTEEMNKAIIALGYESANTKAFQKLRLRLRLKLFDFMLTKSTNDSKTRRDDQDILKRRLKKSNLQATMLREHSFLNQSDELLKNTLRLAKENDKYGEMIEALSEIRKIHEIKANYVKRDKVASKITHYKKLSDRLDEIKNEFNVLISQLDTDLLDHIQLKVIDLIEKVRLTKSEFKSDALDFMEDFLKAALLQYECQFDKSIQLLLKWVRYVEHHPMKFDVQFKNPLFRAFIINLQLCGKSILSENYLQTELKKNKAIHNQFEFIMIRYQQAIKDADLKMCDKLYNALDKGMIHKGKMEQAFIYNRAFHTFSSLDYRHCMQLINDHLRSYSCSSAQQVDLMILEMMCMFEMDKLEILEYKIQSFAKNLNYRKKFQLPEYYVLISKILNNLIRTNFSFNDGRIDQYFRELKTAKQDGLSVSRSYQPVFFQKWIGLKMSATKTIENAFILPVSKAS